MSKLFEITHFPNKPDHMLYICEIQEGNIHFVWGSYNAKKDKLSLREFIKGENPVKGFILNAVLEYLKNEKVLQNGIIFKVV